MHQREWDLNQWLDALENRHAQEIQLGLDRIKKVATKMSLLNPSFKIITVAGTNGKGSTVAALANIYHTAGYKVGSYTSPHLMEFNERIQVNLCSISANDLCKAFTRIEESREDTPLTFFETATLAALWYFKQRAVDIAILEVGLGGRLDATNIIDSDVAIITTIDFDHQDFLGHTLEEIGFEKAGIMRQDKPCIYADDLPPNSIIETAKNSNVPIQIYGRDYFIKEELNTWSFETKEYSIINLPKPGVQLKSAAAAVLACYFLNEFFPIHETDIARSMHKICIPGRLQFIPGKINFLYDVSHNPQGARLLANTIKHLKISGQVHAVFSALKDKDLLGLILPLRDCIDHWYPAQLDNNRAASADLLLEAFVRANIKVDVCYSDPIEAATIATQAASTGDLIVIYGSFYTVSPILAAKQL